MEVTDPVTKQTVALIETYYWKYKRIPNDQELEREYLVDTNVTEVLSTKELLTYLVNNGVPVDGSPTLSPRQVRWIDLLCAAGDPRPIGVKQKDFGITGATHNKWLKNPLFVTALQSRIESILPDERARVHQALARESVGGNVPAMKLYLQMTGELNEGIDNSKADVASLMQGILEILETHVTPGILHALAEDFDYLLVNGVVPLRRQRQVVRGPIELESSELDPT
jgi:hypothetical protein